MKLKDLHALIAQNLPKEEFEDKVTAAYERAWPRTPKVSHSWLMAIQFGFFRIHEDGLIENGADALKYHCMLAEDYTFTFKTCEQEWNQADGPFEYGPRYTKVEGVLPYGWDYMIAPYYC